MRAWLCLLLFAIALGGAACHEDSGVAVKSLTFKGNSAFDDSRLKAVLATRQSGWFPCSAKHDFDRAEFENDAKRLQAFYADRGYPNMRIVGVDVKLNNAKSAVALTITLDEGQPIVVDSVAFQGFDDLPVSIKSALKDAPLKAGQPDDRENVRSTRDLGARLFRDSGYPHAAVSVSEQTTAPSHVAIVVKAEPGAMATFGDTSITGVESVSDRVVQRELEYRPGSLYRESDVVRSQQRLIELGLFQFAHIAPASDDAALTQIPMTVTVKEGPPRQLKLSGGYGSEERVRGTVEWTHLNFLGDARQFTTSAKWSSIDRGLKFNVTQPYVGRRGLSLTGSATAWHTSELTYDSNTYGGRATLVYRRDAGLSGPREPVHRELRVGYVHEYLSYGITQSLGDLSLRAERIALGLNPDTGRQVGTISAVDVDAERSSMDDSLNPHRGTLVSAHLEDAFHALGGTYHFQEIVLEGRVYMPFGKTLIWANRLRSGNLFAASVDDMPFSSRYFLGGSTSVRGWGRFEISPLDPQGQPIGGRSFVEASSELRFPVRGNLSGVAFLDAGQVSAESTLFNLSGMQYAVGPGVRYLTPIGPIRVDLGMQLNPIPGLLINGVPETRHWRLHFSIGQAF